MKQIKCIIFGSISKVKGYERAIEIIEKNPNIFLTIVGPLWGGNLEKSTLDYLKEKEKTLKNLKVEIRMLEEEEFEKYAKANDIILLPYWREVPASGIFPRLLRYLVPMVAWDNSDFKDYEKNFNACITAGSVEELEKKIFLVYNSLEIRNKMREGAKKLLKKRSWDNIAKEHWKLYESLF